MKPVAGPDGEPASRPDDAGHPRAFAANRPGRGQELGREGGAVLDAPGFEARLEPSDFRTRRGGQKGDGTGGGDPENGSDPLPMHRRKIRGFVAGVERSAPRGFGGAKTSGRGEAAARAVDPA